MWTARPFFPLFPFLIPYYTNEPLTASITQGWTPLQTLYAVECLENRTRAKGSGLNFLFLNVAMVVNTYGISVGIEKIGWKLYLVYIGWICVELVIIYFVSCFFFVLFF